MSSRLRAESLQVSGVQELISHWRPPMTLRRLALLSLILVVPAPVFAQAKDKKVDGHPNTYVLGLPSGYAPARKWPLLILLHGSGDRAENMFPMWRTAELTKN